MRAKTRARWEQYQQVMMFLKEFLPSIRTRHRGRLEIRELRSTGRLYPAWFDLNSDYLDNLVRRFLNLPTVQQSRKELDAEVKRHREREMHRAEEEAQFGH